MLLAAAVSVCHPALAATIVVDEVGCTLVDAIDAANTDAIVGGCAAGAGADAVQLTTDVTLTVVNNGSIFEGNALPIVTSDITVEGNGFSIERGGTALMRFFFVATGGALTLEDLVLRNGGSSDSFGAGGAVHVRQFASLTVKGCRMTENAGSIGGAVYAHAASVAEISESSFHDNFGWSNAGALRLDGDCILATSAVYDNASGPNGAGGIGIGGGEFGSFQMVNSTVSGNATLGVGGGIRLFGGSPVLVSHSTLMGNAAENAGDNVHNAFGDATFAGTIVAGGVSSCESFDGTIVDGGGNFNDDGSCGAGFGAITPGVDFDPSLADNGGPTPTHALFPGSVAVDAAGSCGLDTDQRGFPRDDGACDSGAFELAAPPAVPDLGAAGVMALGGGLLLLLVLFVTRRA